MKLQSELILEYYNNFKPNWRLPKGIDLIFPFNDKVIWGLMESFYHKFYSDQNERCMLLGINPGRLGAGMTGIPFTDPIRLLELCGIENDIKKKQELSSVFIYDMIAEFGDPELFYSKIYISSICPLGFTKEGKNYNYYDSKELYEAVESKIVKAIKTQLKFNIRRDVAFSLGQGKNFKILKILNNKYKWFEDVKPLPHPRWVMQYKLKTKQKYLDEYVGKLGFLFS